MQTVELPIIQDCASEQRAKPVSACGEQDEQGVDPFNANEQESGFWQEWALAKLTPVRKLKWATYSRKRNKANENLRTANNPRQSDFGSKNVRSFAHFVPIFALYSRIDFSQPHIFLSFWRVKTRPIYSYSISCVFYMHALFNFLGRRYIKTKSRIIVLNRIDFLYMHV